MKGVTEVLHWRDIDMKIGIVASTARRSRKIAEGSVAPTLRSRGRGGGRKAYTRAPLKLAARAAKPRESAMQRFALEIAHRTTRLAM